MTPSTCAEVTVSALAAILGIAVSRDAGDSQAWGWLKRLYNLHERSGGIIALLLTMVGWERYEALKKARVESRVAFMAMKFGEEALNRAVDECFRPAVRRAGFELRVLTDQQRAGLIDDQIRAALLSARFVVFDLTHGSYGAYWEAGFGEGRGIPVIYTCENLAWETSKTHFDTNHMVTIVWDSADLKRAEDALVATIRATLRGEAKQTDD